MIVYSPMASGLLTGAMTRERAAGLPASDWRSRDVEFQEPKLSKNLALVERLHEVGERHGCPPGQVAIDWVLRNPAVTVAIVGARNAKQVEGNVGASELHLTDEEIAVIEGENEKEHWIHRFGFFSFSGSSLSQTAWGRYREGSCCCSCRSCYRTLLEDRGSLTSPPMRNTSA